MAHGVGQPRCFLPRRSGPVIINLATGELERLFLTTSLPAIQWRWLALPYPATALLLAMRLGLRRGRAVLAPLGGTG